MKSLIILCIFGLFVSTKARLTEEQRNQLKTIYATCEEKTKVDKEQIKLSHEGKKTDDPKLNQYYYCVLTKLGVVDGESKLKFDVVDMDLSKEQKQNLQQIVDKCKNERGKDKYETAKLLFECYWKTTSIRTSVK
uniref:Odorant binding protein 8 n=1 Tax=Agrilus mali TaxID=1917227 RepID=A0A2R4H1F5_9COLE|nr:odorant binding protein 8 [Agrilus mali]